MSHNTIKKWKHIIENSDIKSIESLIHDQATFYSPVVYMPQRGKLNVIKYLSSAVKVFEGNSFKYINNFGTLLESSMYFAEFSAEINKIEVNGIDLIKCEDGLIKEFKVFLRPIKGLEVVWNEMKKNLKIYDNNLS